MVRSHLEYYSVVERKDVLAPTTMWMNLKDTALSDTSQTQDRSCLMPLRRSLGDPHPQRQEVGTGPGGWGVSVSWGQSFRAEMGRSGGGWGAGVAAHVTVVNATELSIQNG